MSWLTYPRTTNLWVKLNCVFFPLIATCILLLWFFLSSKKASIFGEGSVSDLVFGVFSILPGFFLAGFSAAATFGNSRVDDEISDKRTTMPFEINGKTEWEVPSKRLIAIYLFYFLLILSLIVVIFAGIGKFLLSEPLIASWSLQLRTCFSYVFLLVLIFGATSILFTIAQGMSFFVERMTRTD